jgi:cell division initiation protein
MPYTPVELRHVRVARSLLGYDRTAVKNLLAEIADSFETVWRERHEFADHIEQLEGEMAKLRERENALTQTLVAAEQAASHVKDQAKREAEMIVAEAHNEARSVTRAAVGERQRLHADARRIEGLLRASLGMIEEHESVESSEPMRAAEPQAGWPGRDEADEPEAPAAEPETVEPQQPQQPQLRRVSGGFDWAE